MLAKILKKLGYVKETDMLVDVTDKISNSSTDRKRYYVFIWNGKKHVITNYTLMVARHKATKYKTKI